MAKTKSKPLVWDVSPSGRAWKAKSGWHDEGSVMYHRIGTCRKGGFVLGGDVVGVASRYFKSLEAAMRAAQKMEPKSEGDPQ